MSRTVIITGASSGLGLSLTKRFLALGDTVIGITRTKKHWNEASQAIAEFLHKKSSASPLMGEDKGGGGKTSPSPQPNLPPPPARLATDGPQMGKEVCWQTFLDNFSLHQIDLTQEKKVNSFIHSIVKKTGEIDILINCAGYGSGLQSVDKLAYKEFEANIQQNLATAFLMCKHIVPVMRRQNRGLIINISSMAGKRAVPRAFAYSASKFGVLALSQCIAKENADANIKCITVCPGGMNTPMREIFFGKEDAQKQQSPDFVADITMQVIDGKIAVESGGDIVVRHSKITAVNPCPAP
jgi:NAD(P)-dependent dehydrogenase (short-subunit alcohol dehydrogenase family)